MNDLVIRSHAGPYTVRFGSPFAGLESGLPDSCHLIIDSKVSALYESRLEKALAGRSVLKIEAAEESKSLERFPGYVTHLLDRGIRRGHTLTAVGGGIIQDITAFLAAILFRGVPWSFHPTTLLAQADSCIGSKSSINVGRYKNQLGTFTPPTEVRVSTELLGSLSEAEFRSGFGEMIKVHIISGWEDTRALAADYPTLLKDRNALERRIRRSLEIKKQKIEMDEFDRDERLVMNYGHSFGHAIESATDFAVPHGIAVTIGMDMANHLSFRFGYIGEAVDEELHLLLAKNYAGFERVPIPEDRFFEALARDKKNVGDEVTLILMKGPGRLFRDKVPNDDRLRIGCLDYFRRLQQHRTEALCRSR